MEGVINSTTHGVNLVRLDAPSNYHVPQRIPENLSQTEAVLPHLGVPPPPSTTVVTGHVPGPISGPMGGSMISLMKKKRGRPRKYAADGSGPVAGALSPKPISSAPPPPPPVIDFSIEKPPTKIRSIPKQYQPRIETESLVPSGDWVSTSVCANFSPHIITVNAGEDVTMKVISFSQQGPRAVCILSANGVISNVTLRQPDSSGGTLTYEGRFEILSLTGSFMPTETGGMRNRSGGMSVSLASPDGRVVGGGVAGLLVAASPIQIVVGSFLAGNQHEQKTKKPKTDSLPVTAVAPIPLSSPDGPTDESHRWSSLPTSDSMNRTNENNASLP